MTTVAYYLTNIINKELISKTQAIFEDLPRNIQDPDIAAEV